MTYFLCKFVNIILSLYKKVYLTKSHDCNEYFLLFFYFFLFIFAFVVLDT
jgi:hypothetical protein